MTGEWWRGTMTIADLGIYGTEELLGLDPAEVAETKSKLGFNVEHLTSSDVHGGEKGVFYFRTKIADSVPRDFFGEYLPEAKRRGIKVLAYYNVHWLQARFASRHPEWLQVRKDGKAIDDLYGSGCAPCVNSPWRDWSIQGIRDLGSYEIAGVFLDGPIFAPGACYCSSCRRLYDERYGAEMPTDEDWADKTWRDFIDFRYNTIAEYLKDAEIALKGVRSDAIIYMNCTGLWPAWPAARDNRRLMPYQDVLGAEGGFLYYDLRTTPLWKPGMAAKLLETQSGGKPTVVFIAGANKGWDEYLLSPAETRLLYADTVANGANPWYGIPLGRVNSPGCMAAGEMNQFLLDNAEVLSGTERYANIALLWSTRTADYYRASVPVTDFTPQGESLEKRRAAGNFSRSFEGCYEAFTRSHLPFTVFDEGAIQVGGLETYDLLVMPNCACVSSDLASYVEEFVCCGGSLIASFEASRYDENGALKDDFGLADVFGVKVGKGTFGPMRLDYMSLIAEDSSLTSGLSARLLPAPIYGIEVDLTTSASIAGYHEKMPARYVKLPPLSSRPAVVANRFGEGQCLYLAGNFFEHYAEYHNPDYRRMLANAVSGMAEPLVRLENCPSSVEVVLRMQHVQKRLLVHLVNFTGEMTRPIESVTILRDVGLTLPKLQAAAEVRALRSERCLEPEEGAHGVSVTLPELPEYEVIMFQL